MTSPEFTIEEVESETWKSIPEYEGRYEISNLGRIKSLNYQGNEGDHHLLQPSRNSGGYVIVSLFKNHKSKSYVVHRLVARAFLAPTEGRLYVNHKDGIRDNNRVANLEWATAKDNTTHRDRNGSPILGDKHWTRCGARPRFATKPNMKNPRSPRRAAIPRKTEQPAFTDLELASEEWRTVPTLPKYEASNLGRIRRVRASKGRPPNYILTMGISTTGCWQVCLQENKKSKRFLVHRLIALTFLGDPPEGKPWVNHKDGIRTNARVDNLEWVSPKENAEHAVVVLGAYPSGSKHHQAKLTDAQVLEIHDLRMQGISANYIAKMFDVQKGTILRILHRRCWKNLLAHLPTNYPPAIHMGKRGENNPRAKISNSTARKIKSMLVQLESPDVIASVLNVSLGLILNIKYGRSWKHLKGITATD